MKNIFSKLIYFTIVVVVLIITLNMFDNFKDELTNYVYQCKVDFDSNGGTNIDTQKFKCGEKIENYSYPQKDGYVFLGWYIGVNEFDFNSQVVENITLTAQWRKRTSSDTIVSVDGINTETAKEIARSDSIGISTTISPSNATNQNIYWRSSNEDIATVDAQGVVTPKKSGTVTITATTVDGEYKDTTIITITSPVTGIKINEEKIILNIGKTVKLEANVIPSDADNADILWLSSNKKIATVDKNGKVKGISNGTAIITATSVDGGYKATTEVSVQTTVEKITLNKTTLTLDKAKTYDLSYTLTPTNATDKTVQWKSSNKSVAIVDQNGKVTAIGGGETTITVKSNDGNASASCKVTVTSKVNGVSLSEDNIVIGKGGSKKLSATITPADATNKNLTWSSSNSKIVKVDSTGKITGVSDGTATITVTTKDGSYSDKCTVTVKNLVLKINLDKTSATLNKGATYTIKYTVSPSTATNKKVSFASSNTSVATVDSTGKITAVGAGKATITVKSNDGNASSKFTVTVKVPLKGVTLNQNNLTLQQGKTYNLTVTFNPTDATNKNVTWSSSNKKIATVNGSGKITAVSPGSATITVKTEDGSYTATTKVTVENVQVTSVKLNNTSLSLEKGSSYNLAATISPSNAADQSLTWTSSNTAVVKVNGSGKIFAKGIGNATITVKSSNGKSATCKVTVKITGSLLTPITTEIEESAYGTGLLYTNEAYDNFLRIESIRNRETPYMQNFVKIDNYVYVTQAEAYINKISISNTTNQSYVNFGESFGHMDSIEVEITDGKTYVWTSCAAEAQSGGTYSELGRKLCRMKFEDITFPNLGSGGKSLKTQAVDYNSNGYSFSVTSNGVKRNLNGFSIDYYHRLIAIRVGSNNYAEYFVYDLDDFIANGQKANYLSHFVVDPNETSTYQGMAISGNYIYIYEGAMSPKKNNPNGVYLSAYSWVKANGKTFSSASGNLKTSSSTGLEYYRISIGYPHSTKKYVFEPEGIKIIDDKIYVGMVVIANYQESNQNVVTKIFKLKTK